MRRKRRTRRTRRRTERHVESQDLADICMRASDKYDINEITLEVFTVLHTCRLSV